MKSYSVEECNKFLYKTIDKDYIYKNIAVYGTVSSFRTHFSGISFFTLIGGTNRLSCFVGKSRHTFLTRNLESGKEVSCIGDLKFDKVSGKPVLYITRIIEIKESLLQKQKSELIKELTEKGYFDRIPKKLPLMPFHIGVVTSSSGQVIHDIVKTGRMRNDAVRYTLFTSPVQGGGAASIMAKVIDEITHRQLDLDVIIIARGGGAEEDLVSFNEKVLLDAVYRCPIPVISAIGHETDVTLLDRVADYRASTPTQAAEIAIPEKKTLHQYIGQALEQLSSHMQQKVDKEGKQIEICSSFLKSVVQNRNITQRKWMIAQMMENLSQRVNTKMTLRRSSLSFQMRILQQGNRHEDQFSLQENRLQALTSNLIYCKALKLEALSNFLVNNVRFLKERNDITYHVQREQHNLLFFYKILKSRTIELKEVKYNNLLTPVFQFQEKDQMISIKKKKESVVKECFKTKINAKDQFNDFLMNTNKQLIGFMDAFVTQQ